MCKCNQQSNNYHTEDRIQCIIKTNGQPYTIHVITDIHNVHTYGSSTLWK
jgi:hypothetical protein